MMWILRGVVGTLLMLAGTAIYFFRHQAPLRDSAAPLTVPGMALVGIALGCLWGGGYLLATAVRHRGPEEE